MAEQQGWEGHFKVEMVRKEKYEPDFGTVSFETWTLINKLSGDIIGEYRNRKYAKKQARHRYKKLVKLMERTFMSEG